MYFYVSAYMRVRGFYMCVHLWGGCLYMLVCPHVCVSMCKDVFVPIPRCVSGCAKGCVCTSRHVCLCVCGELYLYVGVCI